MRPAKFGTKRSCRYSNSELKNNFCGQVSNCCGEALFQKTYYAFLASPPPVRFRRQGQLVFFAPQKRARAPVWRSNRCLGSGTQTGAGALAPKPGGWLLFVKSLPGRLALLPISQCIPLSVHCWSFPGLSTSLCVQAFLRLFSGPHTIVVPG